LKERKKNDGGKAKQKERERKVAEQKCRSKGNRIRSGMDMKRLAAGVQAQLSES
jgi:hypothetical protein